MLNRGRGFSSHAKTLSDHLDFWFSVQVNTSKAFMWMTSEALERQHKRLLAECRCAAVQKECRKGRGVGQRRGMCSLSAEQSLAAHVHRSTASSGFFFPLHFHKPTFVLKRSNRSGYCLSAGKWFRPTCEFRQSFCFKSLTF